ncbi:MAG: hypothetical protein HWE25_08230 [Alphaproteobacteria bacterium]|nr:hypothetical protein [Alphaproteobacteria bacterium]
MVEQDNKKEFQERRRQLLRLGAAGVPMVLTLKASAAQPVHSALDCSFVIPTTSNILVDSDGRAWIGSRGVREKSGELKVSDIDKFRQQADFVFPNGSAPSKFRPDTCDTQKGWTTCYRFYEIDSNTNITPADYLNSSGNWSLTGAKGLYLALASQYIDTYGNDGGFPGISCLTSILTYLEYQ